MRTTKCRVRPRGLSLHDHTESYEGGHVQIWKEISDVEFNVGKYLNHTDECLLVHSEISCLLRF